MTTTSATPFSGVTAQGLESINGRISRSEEAARAALTESIAERAETLLDVAHPSRRCYEREWVRSAPWRKHDSFMAWSEAVFKSFFNVVMLLAIAILGLALIVAGFGKSNALAMAVTPSLFLAAGIGIGLAVVHYVRAVKSRVDASVGYFVENHVDWRALSAVAMTDVALYLSVMEHDTKLIKVTRLVYDEIQACVFSTDYGVTLFRVFGKDGSHVVVADPRSERIRGAAHLTELVTARLSN